jgi:hypothetical protein
MITMVGIYKTKQLQNGVQQSKANRQYQKQRYNGRLEMAFWRNVLNTAWILFVPCAGAMLLQAKCYPSKANQ